MSKAKFMALAAKYGIEVQYDAGRRKHPRTGEPVAFEITLDAPKGKLFKGSMTHCDCSINGWISDNIVLATPDWNNELHTLEKIIADGFEDGPCGEESCDLCNPEEVE